MQSIRTKNDIEGWHHSLNRRVAGRYGLPLYMFVALLHKEARLMLLQIRLVSECRGGSSNLKRSDLCCTRINVLHSTIDNKGIKVEIL